MVPLLIFMVILVMVILLILMVISLILMKHVLLRSLGCKLCFVSDASEYLMAQLPRQIQKTATCKRYPRQDEKQSK